MKSTAPAYFLLMTAFLVSFTGFIVGVYQSTDVWRPVLEGDRFYDVSPNVYQWIGFLLLLGIPVATAVYAVRHWKLKMRGLALIAICSTLAFVTYSVIVVLTLYAYSDR